MKVEDIDIALFDYPLPAERIAKHPLAVRDSCKLLVADRTTDEISTRTFSELPSLLPADSILVCNNTRVIKARLRMHKPTGAAIEIFCLEPYAPSDYALNLGSTGPVEWTCLVGNSKRWASGHVEAELADGTRLVAERVKRLDGGESVVKLSWDNPTLTFADVLEKAGETPIPPYLERPGEASDEVDYQTVYSSVKGSVAAPTAGLHFTPTVLDGLTRAGIGRLELTLHVGAGTFRPVTSATIGGHAMHSEAIDVSRDVIERIADTDKRVIAVGTTSVRTLESLYHMGCMIHSGEFNGELPQWYPYSTSHPSLSRREAFRAILDNIGDRIIASTRLMIAPGYDFKVVDGMVTNFHQPKSTLLLLVSAFLGRGNRWREIYDYALADGYRFLSYGDACLFL